MTSIGIISNIQPIINVQKIESQISALLFLKTNHSQSIDIANKLSSFPEIKNIYLMTGEYNIVLKIVLQQQPLFFIVIDIIITLCLKILFVI